jgi:ATP-dependent RNA helicase DDX18/HAS1
MDSAEIHSKKRKRKHGGSKGVKEASEAITNGSNPTLEIELSSKPSKAEKVQKAHKKAKKIHQMEDQGEDFAEDAPKKKHKKSKKVAELEEEDELEDKLPEESLDEEPANAQVENNDEKDEEDIEDDLEAAVPGAGALSLPTAGAQAPEKFSELNLSENTMRAINDMKFEKMTEIQQRGIPPLLAGRDVLGG